MFKILCEASPDNRISPSLLGLAFLHSAICPLFYAYNLKDFRAARIMFFRKRNTDLSLSSKVKKRNENDEIDSFSSSDDENENIQMTPANCLF